jgi:hypothetical protein
MKMKKCFLLFLVITGNLMFAGIDNSATKKIVSGKVIDKKSGEELAGVEIQIDGKTIYSDLNGNFSANVDITKTNATLKYISYNNADVTLDPLSYNTIAIELASK